MTKIPFPNPPALSPLWPEDRQVMISSAGLNEKDIYKRMALRIRDFRYQRGYSLSQLATASGIGIKFIEDIEQSRCRPTLYTVEKIASSLDLDFEELFLSHEKTKEYTREAVAVLIDSELLKP